MADPSKGLVEAIPSVSAEKPSQKYIEIEKHHTEEEVVNKLFSAPKIDIDNLKKDFDTQINEVSNTFSSFWGWTKNLASQVEKNIEENVRNLNEMITHSHEMEAALDEQWILFNELNLGVRLTDDLKAHLGHLSLEVSEDIAAFLAVKVDMNLDFHLSQEKLDKLKGILLKVDEHLGDLVQNVTLPNEDVTEMDEAHFWKKYMTKVMIIINDHKENQHAEKDWQEKLRQEITTEARRKSSDSNLMDSYDDENELDDEDLLQKAEMQFLGNEEDLESNESEDEEITEAEKRLQASLNS